LKKSRFTEAQIVSILREVDGGTPVAELARKHGVHANTIRLWRDKYAGMETSDLVRLKQLEAENTQMQRIIARQTIEIDAMKNLVAKTVGALAATRSGEGLAERWGFSKARMFFGRLYAQYASLSKMPSR
jgi:putative transposase